MSDALEKRLWVDQEPAANKAKDPDDRVVEALEKALEATTPSHAGAPWDIQEKEPSGGRNQGRIPEAEGDA